MRSRGVVAALIAIGVLFASSPASAGPGVRKPDAKIGKLDRRLIGNDTYNTDGTDQTLTLKKPRDTRVRVALEFQNDGSLGADTFKLLGCASTTDFKVHYIDEGGDETGPIVAGTYTFPIGVSPSFHPMRIDIRIAKHASIHTPLDCLVTVTSVGDTAQKDAVMLVLKAKP